MFSGLENTRIRFKKEEESHVVVGELRLTRLHLSHGDHYALIGKQSRTLSSLSGINLHSLPLMVTF